MHYNTIRDYLVSTDIDRLHKVVLGECTGIQCGHTYAKCHELVGILETTCDKSIVCIITQFDDIERYLLRMIIEVLNEHKFYPNTDCDDSYIYSKNEHCLWVTVKGFYEKRPVKFIDVFDKYTRYVLQGFDGYYVDFTEGEIR